MRQGTIIISRAADRRIRELARDFQTTPEVVLGLFLTFEVARLEREAPEDVGALATRLGSPVFTY